MLSPSAASRALCVDLHTHSTASDGALSPVDLVARAAAGGVTTLALTDHDTVAGVPEAQDAAVQAGIQLVAGVEISTQWERREIHVVGLGLGEHPVFSQGLAHQQAQRWRRAERIAGKLAKRGYPGAFEAVAADGQRAPGRAHFARWLVEQGAARDFRQVFKRFLGRNGDAWVRADWVSMAAAVRWIHLAGGVAVLAHPFAYDMTGAWRRRLCEAFVEAGGDGVEVVTGRTTPTQVRDGIGLALRHGLRASLGSDFHRDGSGLEPGRLLSLPDAVTPVWSQVQSATRPTDLSFRSQ
ncbi:PHP domain-containing protein [Aquisalimonas sp.]|uniref:PHP domain-containing protein n=1 Tax=unclassified Aquisalimonas TaxID=2644645 RepID=UPI0025B95CE7|nr:PHP domain-containing protein [Aquisalimonas sp.]